MKATTMKNGTLHIEAEGCVVNIKEGLYDEHNKKCTCVTILPDSCYQDEPIWKLKGHAHNRIIQTNKIFRP